MTSVDWMLGTSGSPDDVGERLSRGLNVQLRRHNSTFRGGDYLAGNGPAFEEVIVQQNFEDVDGELAEPDYPEVPVLIYATQNVGEPPISFLESEGFQVLSVEES